jgi:RHS repeat-associated protein
VAQILLADSTDYLLGGSLTMKNGKVNKYLFEGGYAQASVANSTTDNFAFYYYNQDHLGNIREVVNASGSVQQVTNYYPFGAPYADIPAATNPDFQPYKYNGKELDKMHGLNTYDYGARQHDPILARWDRIDPLCEKYYSVSPYVYCMNNPVRFIDPDGREVKQPKGGKSFKTIGILGMAGGTLMVIAGTSYSIVTYGTGTLAGGGQLISAGYATFNAGLATYGVGVALDAHESIKKPDSIKPSDISQKAHTPKKQSTGSKNKTEGRHMHGQTHGGGPKPNFKPQNNKRKKADEHRNKGKVIN